VAGGFGGGVRGPGLFGGSNAVSEWVTTNCAPVTSVSTSLYDCASAPGA